MCIRDRICRYRFSCGTIHYFPPSADIISCVDCKHIPVSYTHLDVYKRQTIGLGAVNPIPFCASSNAIFIYCLSFSTIACGHLVGRGDKNGADGLAVDAMRAAFDTVNIKGTVVIGEGARSERGNRHRVP